MDAAKGRPSACHYQVHSTTSSILSSDFCRRITPADRATFSRTNEKKMRRERCIFLSCKRKCARTLLIRSKHFRLHCFAHRVPRTIFFSNESKSFPPSISNAKFKPQEFRSSHAPDVVEMCCGFTM